MYPESTPTPADTRPAPQQPHTAPQQILHWVCGTGVKRKKKAGLVPTDGCFQNPEFLNSGREAVPNTRAAFLYVPGPHFPAATLMEKQDVLLFLSM